MNIIHANFQNINGDEHGSDAMDDTQTKSSEDIDMNPVWFNFTIDPKNISLR